MTGRLRKVDAALSAMTLGVALSLTANVLATLPDLVRVVAGVAASLTLPTAVHLWRAVPVERTRWKVIRGAVMLGIAALAAVVSFFHAWHLLVAHGEHPTLAACYPISVELLVVMGVLARRTPTKARVNVKREPVAVTSQPANASPPLHAVGRPVPGIEMARQWAREHWRDNLEPKHITAALAEDGVTISKTTASKALKKVARERAA